jgi:hypothetical protein
MPMRDKTRWESVRTLPTGTKYIQISSGRKVMFGDAFRELDDNYASVVRWMSRAFKLADDTEWDERQLRSFIDHLKYMVEAWDAEMEKRHGKQEMREKIVALRQVNGRTEYEQEIFLAKADELEKKMNAT